MKATIFNTLAGLYSKENEQDKAEQVLKEALVIQEKLAKSDPQVYAPDLAITQINIAHHYLILRINKTLSLEFVNAAIANLLPLSSIAYIQEYLFKALNILDAWNIDVEKYMAENFGNQE